MILSVERAKWLIDFKDWPIERIEQKLKAIEQTIRSYTNNNFQNRKIRSAGVVSSSKLNVINKLYGLSIGDTVQITESMFNDGLYTVKGIEAIAWLEEAGGEIKSQAASNSRRASGETAGSFRHEVDTENMVCAIGSDLENALWEEFGTGEYALNGDGRAGAWYVPVKSYTGKRKPTYNGKVVIVHGKNGVDFYKTNGKRGTRALFNAFNSLKGPVQNKVQMNFKDLGD